MHPTKVIIASTLCLLSALSCAERQLEGDEGSKIRCAWMAIYVSQGDEVLRLEDPETGEPQTKVCTCSTLAQVNDPEYRASINELAYERCLDVVAHHGYAAEDSDCLEQYEQNQWGLVYGFPEDSLTGELTACGDMAAGCGAGIS